MVRYGERDEDLFVIENIDFEPDIAGVRIAHLPMVLIASVGPLILGQTLFGLGIFFSLLGLFFFIRKRDDEGRPLALNGRVIAATAYVPNFLRWGLVPVIAAIVPHKRKYRR